MKAPKRQNVSPLGQFVCAALLLTLVIAGFAVTILVFYPGYITVDAEYVYAEAQAWRFGDWQSPAMAVLWRLIDPIAPGSLSMFLLTAILYWASFAILAIIALRYSTSLALLVLLLAFTPPAFVFLGMIWRDVQFGVIWLFAAVLAFVATNVSRSFPRKRESIRGDPSTR